MSLQSNFYIQLSVHSEFKMILWLWMLRNVCFGKLKIIFLKWWANLKSIFFTCFDFCSLNCKAYSSDCTCQRVQLHWGWGKALKPLIMGWMQALSRTQWMLMEWMDGIPLSLLTTNLHVKGVCIQWNEKESTRTQVIKDETPSCSSSFLWVQYCALVLPSKIPSQLLTLLTLLEENFSKE